VIADRVSNPGKGQEIFLLQNPGSAVAPVLPTVKWESGSFRGIKRPGREADHSHLGLNKNECSYTSFPPIHLPGAER
jgi:hypothetical protein